MSERGSLASLAALAVSAALAGCGAATTSGGRTELNWFIFNEPSGAPSEDAPTAAHAVERPLHDHLRVPAHRRRPQREQLVRRLGAEDDCIDLIGMDVIWTAEFAEAGWIQPWTGARRAGGHAGRASPASLETARLRGHGSGGAAGQHAAALVPQGPRAEAAQDLGRDDRRRPRSSARRTAASRCRPTATRA